MIESSVPGASMGSVPGASMGFRLVKVALRQVYRGILVWEGYRVSVDVVLIAVWGELWCTCVFKLLVHTFIYMCPSRFDLLVRGLIELGLDFLFGEG